MDSILLEELKVAYLRRMRFEARTLAQELMIQQAGGYGKARGYNELTTTQLSAKLGVPI